MTAPDPGKLAAARAAAELVEDGMVVGLGTGSTAALFVSALGERVRSGLRVTGIPTSEATAQQAQREGISLTTLEKHPRIDLDVDGADAADPALHLLKGLGGALLREKIVAAASSRFAVIIGEEKLVDHLSRAPIVPVEVIPFGWTRVRGDLESLGAQPTLRMKKGSTTDPFVTDGGHYLLDCNFAKMHDPIALAASIKALTGVVDHGFFIGMATEAIVGRADGSTRTLRPKRS